LNVRPGGLPQRVGLVVFKVLCAAPGRRFRPSSFSLNQSSMNDQTWIWTCDEEIPSKVEAGRDVLQTMLGQLEAAGWSDRDLFGVHLSVEEALVNAIRHGNQLHPEKVVRFECRLSPDLLWVQISDEGDGFDPADVPDPTDPEQLEAPSGRGIMLMRNFMTRVDFTNGGTTVIMEKQATPAQDSQAS